MGWYIRRSKKVGPFRLNLSKRGLGISAGVRGFRVGKGPRGSYIAGGRGGLYFRENLGKKRHAARPSAHSRAVVVPVSMQSPGAAPIPEQPFIPRYFSKMLLVPMLVVSLLPWLTSGFPQSGILGAISSLVMGLFFIDLIAAMVMDWRGFTTLNGRIHWSRHTGWGKTWLVLLYVFLFIVMLPLYLIFALKDQGRASEHAHLEQQRHIAELESDLGIMPATDGLCPHCQKPLQAGAEFCAYCGEPVQARPQVCPVCAATTLPDAQWCPKCGANLHEAPPSGLN